MARQTGLERILLTRVALLLTLIGLLLGTPVLHAQSNAASAQRQRLALVVGIGSLGPRVMLESARRDSQAVAAALRAGGFEVLLREDLGAEQLRAAFKEFRGRLRPEGSGLIYFTGLAAQVDGRNLLLSADMTLGESLATPAVATVLRAAAVSMQEALDALAGGVDSPRLLLVDAAYRTAPLDRLMPPGLARPRLPEGVMLLLGHAPAALQDPPVFDALPTPPPSDPRQLAASRFARVVVDALTTPRISAPEALRAIRRAVLDSSRGRTIPWLAGETFAREDLADAARLEAPAARPPAAAPAAAAVVAPAVVPVAPVAAIAPASAPKPPPVQDTPGNDGRTAPAPGRGERPVFQARMNSFGYAEGDTLSYQLMDTRKDELLLSYTLVIDEVKADGHLVVNGGQVQLDPQGRLKSQTQANGAQSTFEPAQEFWWARPQAGENRNTVFKETYLRADKSRGQIEWRGNSQVGSLRHLETPAGDYEVLPIKTTGQGVDTPAGGQPINLLFTRTVWYAPKLGLPVVIEFEDNDASGRPLRRERIELTHAQQSRTPN